MKYFKKLVGNNIYLSPMNPSDCEKFVEWMSNSDMTNNLGDSKKLVNLVSESNWINNALVNNAYKFSIIRLADDKLLGNIGLFDLDFINQIATIGIFIGDEEECSKGYGKEAITLLLDYGFNNLNLYNISLDVYSFNERAIACYKRAGFKEMGRRRESYYLNNKRYDIVSLDILKDEFNKKIDK